MLLEFVPASLVGFSHRLSFSLHLAFEAKPPNGVRYPLVGGRRQRRFDGASFEPRKLPENAARTHQSDARCVGHVYGTLDKIPWMDNRQLS